MDMIINPGKLCGKVTVPPSKSVAHRLIIAAALAKGESVIDKVYYSKDIITTIEAMRALGAKIVEEGPRLYITGVTNPPKKAFIDCKESGSTLRFLIPVACALGVETTFAGSGRLPQRPITPYIEQLPEHGIEFEYNNTMPFTVRGKLSGGEFKISGGISSQFITGLLLALPLVEGESRIKLTSRLESRPYVDITIGCLKDYGCDVTEYEDGYGLRHSELVPANGEVEGDYSQAAFFYVANALGSKVEIEGLNEKSFQGDKEIVRICEQAVKSGGKLAPFELDCSDIPDLVPILAVLGTFCNGRSYIKNAARLRIKECDRLAAMTESLNALGAKITQLPDGLIIDGVDELHGGTVPDFNDHRIPMAMAIAATRANSPVTIKGAECVSKSYPDFFEVYKALGAEVESV